jgi:hypothetical protein
MRSLFFSLIILKACVCFSWNLDQEALRSACSEEAPAWMQEQIAEDLAPFLERGVSEKAILETFRKIPQLQGGNRFGLVLVQIGATIESKSSFGLSKAHLNYLENLLQALRELDAIVPLPKVSFIVALKGHYDRPYILRFTSAPVFTCGKKRLNQSSVLLPSPLFYGSVLRTAAPPWEKRIPKAFWRGSMTGGVYSQYEWDTKPRARLVFHSRWIPNLLDAGFIENEHLYQLSTSWRTWLYDQGLIKRFTVPQDQLVHRYLVAMDSDTVPSCFNWQLLSGSAILKERSSNIEWYYKGLQPFVHYLPFRSDCSDLEEKILWLKNHDTEAQQIAQNAQMLAKERFTDHSIILYLYHLLKSYATLYKRRLA